MLPKAEHQKRTCIGDLIEKTKEGETGKEHEPVPGQLTEMLSAVGNWTSVLPRLSKEPLESS